MERPPASPTKSRGARLHKHHREQEEVSRSYESNRSTPQPSPPPQATGPVRGKPLIFAAMTSAPDITGVEPAMVGMIGRASAETKIEQGYNAYAQSAHPHHQQQQPTPPPDPTPSQAPDTPSKRKKLSKLHKPTSSRSAEPAPVEVPRSHVAGPSLSSLRTLEQSGTSTSHSHQRGTSVPVATANDALERHPNDADRQNRRKSVASPDGKLHRRPKDAVKPLTDKQMEKLNHRLSYNGVVPGHREQLSPPFRKSFIEEHPESHPIQTAQHRISQAMPSPTSPQGTRHMSPPPPQGSHHTQHMAPPPLVQGSHHTQYMPPSQLPPAQWANPPQKRHMPPQLPTPPEEYNPGMPKVRREPSPQKAPPLPPMDVEELEVAVPLPPKKGHRASVLPPQPADADPVEPMSFPLVSFLSNPVLLENLLAHLSFFEWVTLAQVTKDVRRVLYEEGREQVLERYLSTVGYSRWGWKDPEPLILTADVRDLVLRSGSSANMSLGSLSLHARGVYSVAPLGCHCHQLPPAKLHHQPTHDEGAHLRLPSVHSCRVAPPCASRSRSGTQRANARYVALPRRWSPSADEFDNIPAATIKVGLAIESQPRLSRAQSRPLSRLLTGPVDAAARTARRAGRQWFPFSSVQAATCTVAPGVRAVSRRRLVIRRECTRVRG